MKKITLIILLSSSILSLFNQCEKPDACIANPNDFTLAPYPITTLIQNKLDLEDDNMNKNLYVIAKGLTEWIHSEQNYTEIVQKAQKEDNKTVTVSNLLFEKPNSYKKFNQILSQQVATNKIMDISEDWFDEIVSSMVYNNTNYFPEIYIPNADYADMTLTPIIAIGTDSDALPEEYEDYIPAWFLDENTEIIVSEVGAFNALRPIFIVVNSSISSDIPMTIPDASVELGIGKTETVGHPYFSDYQILYRYDNSKGSEYNFAYSQLPEFGDQDDVEYRGCYPIAKIHKSDVGNLFTNKHCNILAGATGLNAIWLVTYEHDWYASLKNAGFWNYPNLIGNGAIAAGVDCRMKYDSDWYQKHYLTFNTLNQVPFTIDDGKGIATIKWNEI